MTGTGISPMWYAAQPATAFQRCNALPATRRPTQTAPESPVPMTGIWRPYEIKHLGYGLEWTRALHTFEEIHQHEYIPRATAIAKLVDRLYSETHRVESG